MTRRLVLPVLCGVICLGLASPLVAGGADLDPLLDGVSAIGSPGIPGPLCLLSDGAFAVVMGNVDGKPAPVVAAGRLGEGRVVAFGHEGYFGDLKAADTGRLVLNCVRWAAHRAAKEGVPKVGLRGFGALEAHLKKHGVEARQLPARGWAKQLDGLNAVITSPAGLSGGDVKALRKFIATGGGVFAGVPGWGWKQLNPGKSLGDELPGNRLFAQAGVVWADGYQRDTAKDGFTTKGDPPAMAHAGRALDARTNLAAGTGPSLGKNAMALAVSSCPPRRRRSPTPTASPRSSSPCSSAAT